MSTARVVQEVDERTEPMDGQVIIRREYMGKVKFYRVPGDADCECHGKGLLTKIEKEGRKTWLCSCVLILLKKHLTEAEPAPDPGALAVRYDRHATKRSIIAQAAKELDQIREQEKAAALADVEARGKVAAEYHEKEELRLGRILFEEHKRRLSAEEHRKAAADLLRLASEEDAEADAIGREATEQRLTLSRAEMALQPFVEEHERIEKTFRRRARPHERKIESLSKRIGRHDAAN